MSDSKEKRRKLQRACDTCRRRKIRCDGVAGSGTQCRNCKVADKECSYVDSMGNRGPSEAYIESMERRLKRMEQMILQLAPDAVLPEMDFTEPITSTALSSPRTVEISPSASRPSSIIKEKVLSSTISTMPGRHTPATGEHGSYPLVDSPSGGQSRLEAVKPWEQNGEEEDELDEDEAFIMKSLKNLKFSDSSQQQSMQNAFWGKSSGLGLIYYARTSKSSHIGKDTFESDLASSRRPLYWSPPRWELVNYNSPPLQLPSVWPSPKLAKHLVQLFFDKASPSTPVLHRPTFERDFNNELYATNVDFKLLCLGVFACASRCLEDDIHNKPDDEEWTEDDRERRFGKGWMYMNEFAQSRPEIIKNPSIYSLQAICIVNMFAGLCSHHRLAWMCTGMGIRMAVDMGAHRKHVVRSKPKAEGEMLKRAFWALYLADRGLCGSTGRPLAIHDEDIDVDYPADVDDEYWASEDEAGLAFRQPEGKPSKVAAFIQLLKLAQIHGYCLRTIYAINKSKVIKDSHSLEARLQIVAEIDSSLNNWVQQLPDHLRWDPHRKDDLWFLQSAHIYVAYYSVQIYTHRPFISPSADRSQPSFPSLAICSNAARAGANALHALSKRGMKDDLDVLTIRAAFQFGTVLAVNLWGGKRSSSSFDPRGILDDISKIIGMFTDYEKTWLIAGCLKDIITGLVQHAHVTEGGNSTNKRHRESVKMKSQDCKNPDPGFASSLSHPDPTPYRDGSRPMSGLPSSHLHGTMPARNYTPPSRSSSEQQQNSSQTAGGFNEPVSGYTAPPSDINISCERNGMSGSAGYSTADTTSTSQLSSSGRFGSHHDLYQPNPQPQSQFHHQTQPQQVQPASLENPLLCSQYSSTQPFSGSNQLHSQQQQQQQQSFGTIPQMQALNSSMLYGPAAVNSHQQAHNPSMFGFTIPAEVWPMGGTSGVPVDGSRVEKQNFGNVSQGQIVEPVAQGTRVDTGYNPTYMAERSTTPDGLVEPSMDFGGTSDDVTTGLWNAAPEGFEVETWISYLLNLSGNDPSSGQPT